MHGAVSTSVPVPSPSAQATTGGERLRELDILRGVALLGILVVNIETFAGPEDLHDIPIGVVKAAFTGWHAPLDLALLALKWLFVEGKMRALFSMLFGASAALLIGRFEARLGQAGARNVYFRRMFWLLVFGLIHGCLIWSGDILTDYALSGLLVLWFVRKLSGKALVTLGLALFIFAYAVGLPRFLDDLYGSRAPAPAHSIVATAISQGFNPPTSAQLEQAHKEVAQATADARKQAKEARAKGYLGGVPGQAKDFLLALLLMVQSGFITETTSLMLLGMGLYKLGFLSANRSSSFYSGVALAGYAVTAILVLLGINKMQENGFSTTSVVFWMYLPYGVEQLTGTLANIAVILLAIRAGLFPAALNVLKSVGQTAFSNYIFTSVVCQWVFVWGPFGLYGELEYYQQVYVVLGVWALNLLASSLWLQRFNFGPLEWGWRSLTYWEKQPLSRAAAVTA